MENLNSGSHQRLLIQKKKKKTSNSDPLLPNFYQVLAGENITYGGLPKNIHPRVSLNNLHFKSDVLILDHPDDQR